MLRGFSTAVASAADRADRRCFSAKGFAFVLVVAAGEGDRCMPCSGGVIGVGGDLKV